MHAVHAVHQLYCNALAPSDHLQCDAVCVGAHGIGSVGRREGLGVLVNKANRGDPVSLVVCVEG